MSCLNYNFMHLEYLQPLEKIILSKCCQKRGTHDYVKAWDLDEFIAIPNKWENVFLKYINFWSDDFNTTINPQFCPPDEKECSWRYVKCQIKQIELGLDCRCNINCQFCSVKNMIKEIPNDTAKKLHELTLELIDEVKGRQTRDCEFGLRLTDNGEPFFYKKDIISKLQTLKPDDFYEVFITTNGTLFSEKDIIQLKKTGINFKIGVSLNGWDRQSYKRISGGYDYFDKVFQNIQLLLKYDIRTEVSFVVMNKEDIPALMSFINKHDFIKNRPLIFYTVNCNNLEVHNQLLKYRSIAPNMSIK